MADHLTLCSVQRLQELLAAEKERDTLRTKMARFEGCPSKKDLTHGLKTSVFDWIASVASKTKEES